ncbi:hypothetical protein L9F63_001436, partial [Diploptera punctata]
ARWLDQVHSVSMLKSLIFFRVHLVPKMISVFFYVNITDLLFYVIFLSSLKNHKSVKNKQSVVRKQIHVL